MTPFEFISVALSFIVGLGVTHLLTAAVSVFRSRDHLTLDWMPLAWAGSILVFQFQFWWALFELAGIVDNWTIDRFVGLVGLASLLFVAGALVLPISERSGERSLLAEFDRDGRWGLIFLSGYFTAALWANWFYWGVSVFSYFGALVTALLVVPLVFLIVRNRRAQRIISLVYVALSIWTVVAVSPSNY